MYKNIINLNFEIRNILSEEYRLLINKNFVHLLHENE
jgi:hypothetical protein